MQEKLHGTIPKRRTKTITQPQDKQRANTIRPLLFSPTTILITTIHIIIKQKKGVEINPHPKSIMIVVNTVNYVSPCE